MKESSCSVSRLSETTALMSCHEIGFPFYSCSSHMLPFLFKDDLIETNIHPCFCRYDGPQESTNMAIIDVKMLSGFTPDSASVERVSCPS